jgi:hypothetical protein
MYGVHQVNFLTGLTWSITLPVQIFITDLAQWLVARVSVPGNLVGLDLRIYKSFMSDTLMHI